MAEAIAYTEFGGPEVLTLIDVPAPSPAAGEIAVRVEAAGVNPIDWKVRSGLRASDPLSGPRRIGADAAGVVDGGRRRRRRVPHRRRRGRLRRDRSLRIRHRRVQPSTCSLACPA